MLNIGLTTFAENPEPARSDCHAWSASPDYDFLATICGIMPSSAGFATVTIKPALGELTTINGSMPHPLGNIVVSLQRKGANGIEGQVTLPSALTGNFIWKGKTIVLKSGVQKISVNWESRIKDFAIAINFIYHFKLENNGYKLHIVRQKDYNDDEEESNISIDEWLNYVATDIIIKIPTQQQAVNVSQNFKLFPKYFSF